jgi:hypothetical protein
MTGKKQKIVLAGAVTGFLIIIIVGIVAMVINSDPNRGIPAPILASQKKSSSENSNKASATSQASQSTDANKIIDAQHNITVGYLRNLAKDGILAIRGHYNLGDNYKITKINYGITNSGVSQLDITIDTYDSIGKTDEYIFDAMDSANLFQGSTYYPEYKVSVGLNNDMIVFKQPTYNEQGGLIVSKVIALINSGTSS